MAFHPYPQVIPAFCNRHGFGPPRACSARFTLPMGSSPGFGSFLRDWSPFRTRFPSGSGCSCLSLATPKYSSAHSTKGTPSPLSNLKSSDRLEAHGFRIYFTPLVGVLFTIPSRYWFTIGRWSYLALGGGPPSFPPNITCWAVLTVLHHWWDHVVAYGTLTRSGLPFQYSSADGPPSQRGVGIPLHPDRTTPHRQRIPARTPMRFGLCPVRSPLLRASSLFLGVLRCFSSPGSLPLRVDRPSRLPGCPIRRSRDHQAASASPEHFVAWPRPSSASSAKASTVCPSFRSIHPRGFPTSADHPARLVPRRDNEPSRLPLHPLLGEGDGSHLWHTASEQDCPKRCHVPIFPSRWSRWGESIVLQL